MQSPAAVADQIDVNPEILIATLLAAVALVFERLCYLFAWRRPVVFGRYCLRLGIANDPVVGLERLFYGFKLIQFGVFGAWILGFSSGQPGFSDQPMVLAIGGLLIAVGQALNFGSFWRLGRIGIFYGVRFGHAVAWCEKFPFSIVRHPQYVGTVLSIFGLFLIFRFPHVDWAAIPLLETAYYWIGSIFEQETRSPGHYGTQAAPSTQRKTAPAAALAQMRRRP